MMNNNLLQVIVNRLFKFGEEMIDKPARILSSEEKQKAIDSEPKPAQTSDELKPYPLPKSPRGLKTRKEVIEWIEEGIKCFREWYQPVEFGYGVVAHVTKPPDWKEDRRYVENKDIFNDRGLAKWNLIVKKHLPKIKGARVLDVGCSSGVFCLELAKAGAREVIGIDRDVTVEHRSTKAPPPQDVIAQAMFVKKAYELLHKKKLAIKYLTCDVAGIEELQLGRFDFVLALNVVYHELDGMGDLIEKLGEMTDCLVLQANQGHPGKLADYCRVAPHIKILLEKGFTQIEIDAPEGYALPLIVARK